MHQLSILVQWLFPRRCCFCRKLLTEPQALCETCRQALPWNHRACQRCALPLETDSRQCGACLTRPPAFVRCIAPFRYQPPISTAIIQLKFHEQLRYAPVLAQLLAEAVRQQDEALPECLIPIPLHTQRLRQRGFNQAVEIAKPLGKALNIPILRNHCYRRKNTLPQSQLSAPARRRNMRAAFDLRRPLRVQHVAIIDDVMTTGQTAQIFSRMLSDAGVKRIQIWCCARA
jgi:ComF family protein